MTDDVWAGLLLAALLAAIAWGVVGLLALVVWAMPW